MKALSSKQIILFLIISTISIYGQGILKGTVKDSLAMDKLKGAEINLTSTTFSTISDIDGEFRITGIPSGEYILQASYLGYKGKKYLVNIKSEETLSLNVELMPDIIVGGGSILTDQARSQAEEINMQLGANTIKNVIAGRKLQDMPDENIPMALSRLPGVSILYKTLPSFNFIGSGTTYMTEYNLGFDYSMPADYFPVTDDPVLRVLIRGLDSKYSNITLDGIRISPTSATDKSIDLSIISERDFKNIELHKTITSDEDADATAGVINIVTEKAPYKRMINARLTGNYNKFDKSANQYNFAGSYGERFFDNVLGVQVDAKAEKRIASNEYQKNNLDMRLRNSRSYTNTLIDRYGANVLFDIITPDGGVIKYKTIFSKTSTEYFASQADFSNMTSTPPDHTFYNMKTEQKVFLSSIGGRNYLYGFDVDWNAAFSESRNDHPYYFTLNSKGNSFIGPRYEEFLLNTIDNPSKNYSKEKTASIDFTKNYIISSEIAGELKFGGKFRDNSKSYSEILHAENGSLLGNNQYIILADGTKIKKDFSGTRFDGLLGKGVRNIFLSNFQDNPYGMRIVFDSVKIPLINKDALGLWRQLNYGDYFLNDGADINSYNYSESVFAGYVMHELNFGKIAKIIAGLRIESEQNNYSGYYFPDNISLDQLYTGKPQQTNTYDYNETNILPNIQLLLKPADFLNLRLAVYKTLIKPDYIERIPKIFHIGSYLNMGNPELKNANVWNSEFQTQFYGNDLGQFSINVFYKEIKGMPQTTDGIQLKGINQMDSLGINWSAFPVNYTFQDNSSYYLYSYINSSKPTRIWGLEIEHQTYFRFLPGLLKNIILNYNLTFLRSETWGVRVEPIFLETTEYRLSGRNTILDNTPEFTANVVLGYDIQGFSFRISYLYQDEYPITIKGTDYSGVCVNKFSRLDIAVKQQILENVSIVLNLNNITNSKEEYLFNNSYQGKSKTIQAYRYGFNFNFGIGINL